MESVSRLNIAVITLNLPRAEIVVPTCCCFLYFIFVPEAYSDVELCNSKILKENTKFSKAVAHFSVYYFASFSRMLITPCLFSFYSYVPRIFFFSCNFGV